MAWPLEAPFAVLNTAYFLAEANLGGSFSDPERLAVFDEADTLEAQLLDAVSVRLSEQHLQRLRLAVPRLTAHPEQEDWCGWAAAAAPPTQRGGGGPGRAADPPRRARGQPHP